ncbi:MAG: PAS domain-containing protein [Bacteroidetes bacterium]|nr:PAS domain-containing protein [Bacteroidota bacterium]
MPLKEAIVTEAPLSQVKDKLHFKWLPGFAKYLRVNHLEAYVQDLIRECRALDVPLMRVLKDMPEEQLIALSLQSHGDFLQAAEENRLREKLEESLQKWESNDIDIIARDDIATEDLTLGTYVRKTVMLKYLPGYTSDAFELLEIIKEIDIYDEQSVTSSLVIYKNILREKIAKQEQQLLEAQALGQLGSFEWDLVSKKTTATPQLLKILDLDETGDLQSFMEKVHRNDKERVLNAMKEAMSLGGSYECEYRLLTRNGEERVVASKGIVTFRDGKPYRFNGTVADITEKQKMIDRLSDSDRLFKQAQAMSHIGSWTWEFETNKIEWSDELYRIYNFVEGTELTFDRITDLTHPDDKERMTARLRATLEEGHASETIYRICTEDGHVKILHAKSEVLWAHGKPYKLIGTIQDVTERQTMLEELQRSDVMFKQAQAQTHIGNWSWDVLANKVTWSDEMFRIYGMEPQSTPVSFETYISHVHPDYRDKRLQQVQHVFETGEPEDHIYKIIAKDGKIKILHSKSEVQTDANGKVISMTGTCQDVTERQTLIDKLQDSESLYKQAQEMAQMGSWTWDLKTDHVTWTDEMYDIYELDKNVELTRKFMVSFQHEEDRRTVEEGLQALMETNVIQDFNYRIVTGKGKTKILHAIKELVRDGEGRPVKVIGTTQDVTRQKEAEKELRDSKEFIQKIADTTPSIIASYNINTGQYLYISGGLTKLLGYEPEEGVRGGVAFFSSIVHPEDLERITQQNAEALMLANNPANRAQNFVAEFKYRMRHKNGEYRWFHTFGTVFERDANGMVQTVLNISIDITMQEEAERVLHQKNLELQQSNASLQEYAYVASHDLKEPLRKICTFGDRLTSTQYENLDEKGKVYLQKIIDSSLRMQLMINDLLSISVVSGNKNFESASLQKIVQDALQFAELKIEAANAKITVSDLPEAKVVPSQMRQLFQNLINNSLKFTREGVQPEIKIEHRYLSPKEVVGHNLAKARKYLEITVSDNGIGFENEFANKIFTIFQRLHGRNEYEGTGIGLAICKKVVENHGGTIFANAIKNEGATFTIILPS